MHSRFWDSTGRCVESGSPEQLLLWVLADRDPSLVPFVLRLERAPAGITLRIIPHIGTLVHLQPEPEPIHCSLHRRLALRWPPQGMSAIDEPHILHRLAARPKPALHLGGAHRP